MTETIDDDDFKATANRRLRYALIFVFLAALGVVAYSCGLFHKAASESQLRTAFFQNQSDFVKLVQMSDQDPHVTLIRPKFTYLDTDASWPRKSIGFSQDRWDEYRSIFRKLSLDGGVTRRPDYPSTVFITAASSGGVLGSSDRGYAYSKKPLMPIVESLDVMPRDSYNKNKGHAIVFKPLGDNWYMFREDF